MATVDPATPSQPPPPISPSHTLCTLPYSLSSCSFSLGLDVVPTRVEMLQWLWLCSGPALLLPWPCSGDCCWWQLQKLFAQVLNGNFLQQINSVAWQGATTSVDFYAFSSLFSSLLSFSFHSFFASRGRINQLKCRCVCECVCVVHYQRARPPSKCIRCKWPCLCRHPQPRPHQYIHFAPIPAPPLSLSQPLARCLHQLYAYTGEISHLAG